MGSMIKPDAGKLLYLAIGVVLATYTGLARFLPRK